MAVVAWNDEFLVNTTTLGNQMNGRVVALADGRFFVVWTDAVIPELFVTGNSTRFQLFNADGTKSGGEVVLDRPAYTLVSVPSVAALADGGFAISWTDDTIDPSDWSIRSQVFNGDGTERSGQILANTINGGDQSWSASAGLVGGRYVVTWNDDGQNPGDTSGFAVRGQMFNADGTMFGASFLVNTTTFSNQIYSSITALTGGGFVVSWSDDSAQAGSGDTSVYAARAQIFDASGNKVGTHILLNTTTSQNQAYPKLAALDAGKFVAVWEDASASGGDTSGLAVRAQMFNADGTKSGTEILVNTSTTGSQSQPEIASLLGGRFVIVWTDASQLGGDNSVSSIKAQAFNADGTTYGGEILVNQTTAGAQSRVNVTGLADGRFVVRWDDNSQSGGDTSDQAQRARIFDPRDAGRQSRRHIVRRPVRRHHIGRHALGQRRQRCAARRRGQRRHQRRRRQ